VTVSVYDNRAGEPEPSGSARHLSWAAQERRPCRAMASTSFGDSSVAPSMRITGPAHPPRRRESDSPLAAEILDGRCAVADGRPHAVPGELADVLIEPLRLLAFRRSRQGGPGAAVQVNQDGAEPG
jgi:hypothetical protein